MKRTYIMNCYPWHGYGVVPTSDIVDFDAIGIISNYSYLNKYGTTAYLEEGNDFPKYIKHLENKGVKVTVRLKHLEDDRKIRSMNGFGDVKNIVFYN